MLEIQGTTFPGCLPAKQGAPLPGLPDGPPGGFFGGGFSRFCWRFGSLTVFFFSTWITGEEEEQDTMGCCSGRCTLAFICGMQLVSVEIIIKSCMAAAKWADQSGERRSHEGESEKTLLLWWPDMGCGWIDGWMAGRR